MKNWTWIAAAAAGGGLLGTMYGLLGPAAGALYAGGTASALLLSAEMAARSLILGPLILAGAGTALGVGSGAILATAAGNPMLTTLGGFLGGLLAAGLGVALLILRRSRVADPAGRILLFLAFGITMGVGVLAPFALLFGLLAELNRPVFYPYLDPGAGEDPPEPPDTGQVFY